MNKTVTLLALAGGLALTALVLGLPHVTSQPVHSATPSPSKPPPPLPPPPPPSTSQGSLAMTSRLSHPYITPGSSDVFVTVDITGQEVPGARRSPVNLALIIDRSGSMSGYKLEQAKQAARHLVTLLKDDDRLAIVHYGSDVKSLPGLQATPANRERMIQYIEGIWDEGGTNISAGLLAGQAQVETARSDYRVNRLILISDGQPTEGSTDEGSLKQVVKDIRTRGITVSSIGVGTDFNEDLMQAFAEYGAGSYGFLEDAGKLATLFQKDLQQASTQVARNVELSFELPQGIALGEVLGYRANTAGSTVRVALTDFSAGQTERVVARVVVTGSRVGQAVDVTGLKLAYTDLLKDKTVETASRLSAMVTDQREEVLARQDKDATVYATRARSAQNLQKAAEALKKGRREEAKQFIQQNQQMFQEAASVAGAPAVAADMADQDAAFAEYEKAASADDVNTAVKRSKTQALKSFGRLGSTY
ncbi:vWA domain-containing protein [Stigmatella aurantiaca]|uniref:von Willebrand factor type A domain protein n=1 Tax=Stigmatella aurantiaca (strain DW4/3-1) TaxID=378806 RepID=Q093T2_STIAD|nr:VWA domain-containing protein [Stigmatella aurantiaca]ADO71050.1 von Willebrand factor type A domain protein [Stigmatella aurantiaca DW4/3-1]EAU66987.1 von Willebrand factor type A domain protein [Stigmatella aurantiaca DW4/3-1]